MMHASDHRELMELVSVANCQFKCICQKVRSFLLRKVELFRRMKSQLTFLLGGKL